MTEEKLFIINTIKDKITSHHLLSGEVILCFENINGKIGTLRQLIDAFLKNNGIKTETLKFDLIEISDKEAIKSICYGLSTKPNYTAIQKEFLKTDQNTLSYSFCQLFDKPKFYSLNTRIYQMDLNLGDFWESGGAIAIDKNMIGLFWVNDLYGL